MKWINVSKKLPKVSDGYCPCDLLLRSVDSKTGKVIKGEGAYKKGWYGNDPKFYWADTDRDGDPIEVGSDQPVTHWIYLDDIPEPRQRKKV